VTDTTPTPTPAVSRTAAMTVDSQRPIAAGVALIFGALIPVHLFTLPGDAAVIMASVAAVTSLIMLLLWVALHTELRSAIEGHAQAVGAFTATLVCANTLIHVASVGEPWPTCAVMLAIVGTGAALAYRAVVVAVIVVTDLAWLLIAVTIGHDPLWDEFGAQLFAATVLAGALNVIRHRTVARLESAQAAVTAMAVTDELTGLKNRRGLLLVGEPMLEAAHRADRQVTVLYLDVDGLKQVNDHQGHAAGDRLIAGTGEILKTVFRSADVVARLGGDEFAVMLSGSGDTEAAILQERLRSRLAEGGVSASVGVVHLDPGATYQSLEQLIDMADLAMYAVKRDRRSAPAVPSRPTAV
jgi:diguanylate cyclase (GGDEF)-like protein